jgi:hypothetical protein
MLCQLWHRLGHMPQQILCIETPQDCRSRARSASASQFRTMNNVNGEVVGQTIANLPVT